MKLDTKLFFRTEGDLINFFFLHNYFKFRTNSMLLGFIDSFIYIIHSRPVSMNYLGNTDTYLC